MKRHSAQKTDTRYAIGLTTGFLILGGFTAFNHEMWRDEIQAWLLARDSASFFELFAHLKYEGHPGLWHLCLMPLSRITASPVIMQVFHLLIAGVTVYLFARYAPFNWLQKFLFCFGYFVLYEYAVIARNYALGLLLLTLFCVLFRERYKRPLWIGGILFLLAHTSVHALIVTIAISFALFCEYFLMNIARLKTAPTAASRRGPVGALCKRAGESARLKTAPTAEHHPGPVGALCKRALESARLETAPTAASRLGLVGALFKRAPKHTPFQTAPTNNTLVWLTFALICIGILTSVLQLKPPVDTGFAVGWKFDYETSHLFKVIKLISRAYLPIPKPTLHFWNSHQLETYPFFQTLQMPLCFLLIFCGVVLTYKRPTALLIYLTSTLGLLAFFYVKYYGSIRHHGFLFLTFVMVAWIYRESARLETTLCRARSPDLDHRCRRAPVGALCKRALASARLETAPTVKERAFSILLTLILACHFIGGVTAVFMENRHIFSCGKQTAEYIKARGMREMPMVGDTDFAVSTVVGYLEKEAIYYPRGSRFGSFIRWDAARTAEVPTADVLEAARTLSMETSRAVLLILNRAVNARLQEQYRLIDVARFTGSIIGDEEFFIYRMPAP